MLNMLNFSFAGLFVLYLWANWRDHRLPFFRDHRWVIPKLTRTRAVKMALGFVILWGITLTVIFFSPKTEFSELGEVCMVLTMVLAQVCILRRTEFFQVRGPAAAADRPGS